MTENDSNLRQLRWAVQALAAAADDQRALFQAFVCPACELLSDFDNWYAAAAHPGCTEVTEQQRRALAAIEEMIDGVEATPCFSLETLRDREDWQRLRLAAASCLASFDWDRKLPPAGRSEYVRGG